MIHLIRSFDTETIPLVAGFDWAYDLTPLREEPINADKNRICYSSISIQKTGAMAAKMGRRFWFCCQYLPYYR